MSFVEFTVKPDFKAIDELIGDIESAPPRFNALVQNLVTGRGGYIQRIEREITPYPGKPRAGITKLMTPRQRRAYFATNGFGKGIPYRRTGGLGRGWRIVFKPLQRGGDGSIQIYNVTPGSEFVVGLRQQPFHLDTGWIRIDKSQGLARIQKDLMNDLIAAWGSILTRPKGRFR